MRVTAISGRYITTYAQWRQAKYTSINGQLRDIARCAVLFSLSITSSPKKGSGWIRFPFYHHVFDDERKGFERQLRCLREWGDFVSIDEACAIIGENRRLRERMFCISFDDGFMNCLTNALPILKALDCPAAFFIQTNLIGIDAGNKFELLMSFSRHAGYPGPVELLNWESCRELLSVGMTIGSHTASHAILLELDEASALEELKGSKAVIERKLGIQCRHFACPWGVPGVHFRKNRDPMLAAKAGYATFLTNTRGLNRPGDDLFSIRRDHLMANWPAYQMRYFMRGA